MIQLSVGEIAERSSLSDGQVIELAEAAKEKRNALRYGLAEVSREERRALIRHAQRLAIARPAKHELLTELCFTIKESRKYETFIHHTQQIEERRKSEWMEGRAILKAIARIHYRGMLIGGTQVQGYKAQGTKAHYGTPRKHRK